MSNELISEEILDSLIKKEEMESTTGYGAFVFWARMTPAERALPDAIKKTAEYIGLEESTVKLYRVQCKWDERINLIEAYLLKVQFMKRNLDLEEHNKKFTEEVKRIQSKAVKLSVQCLDVAETLLGTVPLANKLVETEWRMTINPSTGAKEKKPLTTQVLMETKTSDIAGLIRCGVDTPNKVIGLPTERIQHNIVQADSSSLQELSLEEINERRMRIRREKEKLLGPQELDTVG